MSKKDDVREFLISRRANVTPERAGLPDGGERRVPGLRREEVAMLAGVSTDYYTRLERGKIRGASESVLNAIARALQLDEVERAHLFDLARTATAAAPRRKPAKETVRASVRRVLDNMTIPAVVVNAQQDVVASNLMGRALFAPHFEADRPNLARFIFLDSRARDFYADWPLACRLTAAMLRFEAGRDPLNHDLTALIGELSTRSPQFRTNWAEQDVHEHRTGHKIYRHPELGELDLGYDVFDMPGEPGLSIATYTAEEGTPTADKLALLASWAAAEERDSNHRATSPNRRFTTRRTEQLTAEFLTRPDHRAAPSRRHRTGSGHCPHQFTTWCAWLDREPLPAAADSISAYLTELARAGSNTCSHARRWGAPNFVAGSEVDRSRRVSE